MRLEGHEVVELRKVLPVNATDAGVLQYAQEHGLLLVTCNPDDFPGLIAEQPNPGLIILVRRRTRQAECARLLTLIASSGEEGLRGGVNFA